MAIFKRKNSRYYWVKFTFQGETIRESTECANRKAALNFEASLRHQLNYKRLELETLNETKAALMFETALADFLDWSEREQAESTFKRYESSSKALLRFFKGMPIESIKTTDVKEFRVWRLKERKQPPALKLRKDKRATTKKTVTNATVNREVACLSFMFSRLIEDGIAEWNPAHLKRLKEDNEKPRAIPDNVKRAYLLACPQPLRDAATIIFESGMRPAEVLALRDTDLNFDLGLITVRKGKSNAAARRLYMSDACREILAKRCAETKNGLLFPGGKGGGLDKPAGKLNNAHSKAIERSGVPKFRLYDARHTYATRAAENGIDLLALKGILGHTRTTMSERYAKPGEQYHLNAMKQFDESKPDKKVA